MHITVKYRNTDKNGDVESLETISVKVMPCIYMQGQNYDMKPVQNNHSKNYNITDEIKYSTHMFGPVGRSIFSSFTLH